MHINGYQFEGRIINRDVALAYGLESDEIEVCGEYTIDWDDDIPVVSLVGDVEIEYNIPLFLIEDDILKAIEDSADENQWWADRQAEAYDAMFEDQ